MSHFLPDDAQPTANRFGYM